MEKIKVKVKRFQDNDDLSLPKYMSDHASGMDLFAAVNEDVKILPNEIKLIPTGISISIPIGYEAEIRPRSGMALKNGISLVNAPGTIDSDYRGEIKIIVINHGQDVFKVSRGDRIAQMIFCPVVRAELVEVKNLDETPRNEGGFGSTKISEEVKL